MATAVQEKGHLPISSRRVNVPMTDPQMSSSGSAKAERTSVIRVVLWTTVAVALIVGLVLFFRYTRLMTPLL